MHSSISSSDPAPLGLARFFAVILVVLGLPVLVGHLAGQTYQPTPLTVPEATIAAASRVVVGFGNSRLEAAVDPAQLSAELSAVTGAPVAAMGLNGGGWDTLHYYQLALLNRDRLRPHRDVVLIEVSPLSLDDSRDHNHLGVIRPETCEAIAALPGAPIELRLDVLLGGAAGLYRYRPQFQRLISRRLDRERDRLLPVLAGAGLLRAPAPAPFELILEPGRNFVIHEVRGDRAAFQRAARRQLEADFAPRTTGFKREALRRAVRLLREREIEVFLVQVPVSAWLSGRLAASAAGPRFRDEMRALAAEAGARLLDEWPAELSDESNYFDEMHMVSAATRGFTHALAATLGPALDPPPAPAR
jgi:hypothetical protein